MDLLSEAKKGTRVFSIGFPTGEAIAFRALTWREFSIYQTLSQGNTIPPYVLEKALFDQCVIDQYYIEAIYDMPAGIVATVCSVIMHISGPTDNAEEFNQTLDIFRNRIDTLDSQIEMVICGAFPGYTPEIVRAMTWDKVLMRLAQAERILMRAGQLEEPLKMLTEKEAAKHSKSGMFDLSKDMDETKKGMRRVDNEVPIQEDKQVRQLTPQQTQQLDRINTLKRKRRG